MIGSFRRQRQLQAIGRDDNTARPLLGDLDAVAGPQAEVAQAAAKGGIAANGMDAHCLARLVSAERGAGCAAVTNTLARHRVCHAYRLLVPRSLFVHHP